MLLITPTPIGNLGDITLRALETLKTAPIIIAENPRHTQKLLKHFDIEKKKLVQFSEPNEDDQIPKILELLKTSDGALITDAGTPGISDPGFRLVRACLETNIEVDSLPGPSAVITSLAGSGLPTDKFWFVGFMPRTEPKITELIKQAKVINSTLIAYESPHRIIKSVKIIASQEPDAKTVVSRELTKLHQEYIRGKSTEVLSDLESRQSIKGEITLLISFK